MTGFDYDLDQFMLYCESKNLSKKTLSSYEQTLKLFFLYLEDVKHISKSKQITVEHIREYIKYLKERGKYTVPSSNTNINHPDRRTDLGKPVSDTTIANYLRNIKVFLNFMSGERLIPRNPAENVANIKPQRKQKPLLSESDLKRVFQTFDLTTFFDIEHGFKQN